MHIYTGALHQGSDHFFASVSSVCPDFLAHTADVVRLAPQERRLKIKMVGHICLLFFKERGEGERWMKERALL